MRFFDNQRNTLVFHIEIAGSLKNHLTIFRFTLSTKCDDQTDGGQFPYFTHILNVQQWSGNSDLKRFRTIRANTQTNSSEKKKIKQRNI